MKVLAHALQPAFMVSVCQTVIQLTLAAGIYGTKPIKANLLLPAR